MIRSEELQLFLEVLEEYECYEEIQGILKRLYKTGLEDKEIIDYLKINNKSSAILNVVRDNMAILDNYEKNRHLFIGLTSLLRQDPINKLLIIKKMDEINENNISDDEILILIDDEDQTLYDYIFDVAFERDIELIKTEAERLHKLEEVQRTKDFIEEEPGSSGKEILLVILFVLSIIIIGLKSCSNGGVYYYNDDYEEDTYRGR